MLAAEASSSWNPNLQIPKNSIFFTEAHDAKVYKIEFVYIIIIIIIKTLFQHASHFN